ncbi:MAG TPA: hypothetical protein VLJ37_01240 [bacterium]|nr:hypothetical protein [bacterium]
MADTLKPDTLFQESLKLCGDPAEAESQWEGLRPCLSAEASKTDGLRFLFALLGNSRFLVHRLLQAPDPTAAIDALVLSPHLLKPKEDVEMLEELRAELRAGRRTEQARVARLLRDFKYREITRIAARDLAGLAPFEEIGAELADLAAACTEAAVEAAGEIARAGESGGFREAFLVLAMGKFGGRDLNFSSDIDLLYVHGRPVAAEAGSRSVFEHFCRVSEMVTRLLHDRTEDGFVFRVDLDLRPEGKSGVIVNSVDALASYYEISGADWERAALIKARPVAGDAGLGRETLALIEPFVFPKYTDASAIDGLKRMKEKINADLKKSKAGGFHVKLGTGGIREIEFFVTAFQLLFGGKEPRLRERHTLTALRLLGRLGLVPEEDVSRLEEAYVFLRRIENRLQMQEERQTHRLPTDAPALAAMARRMGFAATGDFEAALKMKTDFVASCFERLAS